MRCLFSLACIAVNAETGQRGYADKGKAQIKQNNNRWINYQDVLPHWWNTQVQEGWRDLDHRIEGRRPAWKLANDAEENECTDGSHNCHIHADCVETYEGFGCFCLSGYTGDGIDCTDIDECATGTDNCHENSECLNIDGSFECTCPSGYVSVNHYHTQQCHDIDECFDRSDDCHTNANCKNIDGSFECSCKNGFTGDGKVECTDVDECTASESVECPDNSVCRNLNGSFSCDCVTGYTKRNSFYQSSCQKNDEYFEQNEENLRMILLYRLFKG